MTRDDLNKEEKIELKQKEELKKEEKVEESINNTSKIKEKIEEINQENREKEEKINETKQKEEIKQEQLKEEKAIKDGIAKRVYKGFKDVWYQTFPGEENTELKFHKRMEEAKIIKERIKEPTEEEIIAAESLIPEWKKGALVLIIEDTINEKKSIFDIATDKMKKHVRNSESYKNFVESDAYKELQQIKTDYLEAKKNFRDEISGSQNPFIVVSRDLLDKVQVKSTTAHATNLMRKIDPNFDLFEFEKEVDFIFKKFFEAFLNDDIDFLEKVSANAALGMMSGVIKARKELKAECKYKELLWIDKAQFISTNLPEQDNPVFVFRLYCQEISCLVSKQDRKVVQGEDNSVESCQYEVSLQRNHNPEIDIVGHPWLIVNVERRGVVKQLI